MSIKHPRYFFALCGLLCGLLTATAHAEDSSAQHDAQYLHSQVAEAYIELRFGPGRGYAVFYIAERGETIRILKGRTDWYKVANHKGVSGWVHADDIAKTLDSQGQPLPIPQPNHESYLQRDWEVGMLAGDFGGNDAISVYGGYHFNKNLSAEISYGETFGDIADAKSATVSLVHQPFPEWRVSPFLTLGGGVYRSSPKSHLAASKSRSDNSSHVGIGARIYLAQRLFMRLQYKNHLVLTDRDDDEEVESWTIGIGAFY